MIYYYGRFSHWSDIVPFHPVLTYFLALFDKISSWGFAYGDLLAVVFAKSLSEKLAHFSEKIKWHQPKKLIKIDGLIVLERGNTCRCRAEFLELSDLSLQIEEFVGPLILLSYANNVYLIVINVS